MTNRMMPIWPFALLVLAAAIFSGTFSNMVADWHEYQHQWHLVFQSRK